jgi:5-methyltetrahydrofolate--homocysteine methyltransferase
MKADIFHDNQLIFFDGAMGTMIQAAGLKSGELPETFNITRPEVIESIHRAYLEAGSDVITTNTFGANNLKLNPLGYSSEEMARAAVSIARKAAGSDRLVALDIGPLGQLMAPMGNLTFQDAYDLFAPQIKAGQDAGADLVLIETMSDLYEAKAAVLAAKENSQLPVICTLTFQENGRTLMGNDPITVITVLEGLGVDALGS